MQKIQTLFERDWDGDRSRVLPQFAAGTEWVAAGEGVATRKYDGSAVLVEDGKLFKRLAIKEDATPPEGFIEVEREQNERTGVVKIIGWVLVSDGAEDSWHRDAFALYDYELPNGTYELLGPKVQGNPEGMENHVLLLHGDTLIEDAPTDFEGLLAFFEAHDVEGIVWHHPDGRMAKIKARDFGLKRAGVPVAH